MTSNDILDEVAAARPPAATATRLWPEDQRAGVLSSIVDGTRVAEARRSRRRYAIGAAAAAVLALALIGGSIALPSDGPAGPSPAAAAVIARLAVTAGAAPADTLRPGQYWRSVERSTQRYAGDQPPRRVTKQSWRGTDGTVWRRDSVGGRGETYVFPPERTPSLNAPTPALLATFPTDRTELRRLIDDRYAGRFGSEEHEERVLIAVGDMLRQGFAPPALRAAALGVLAEQPGIRVREGVRDEAGRTVTEVGFATPATGDRGPSENYLLIDPTTSRIVGERQSSAPINPPDGEGIEVTVSYSSVTLDAGVVDSVPANVRRTAVDQSRSVDTECSVNGTC